MKGLLIAFCAFVASATTAKASEPAVQSATMAKLDSKLDSITLEAQEAHLNMLVSCAFFRTKKIADE